MSTVLFNAHVITGDGRDFDDAAVKIENGRIVAVETNGGRPSADHSVDLEGQTLMPGMIDLHVHMVGGDKAMGFGDEATTFRMNDSVVKAALDGVGAAWTTLHAGVTAVREIAARDFVDVDLKRAQLAGQLVGPRMLATGPGVFMTGGHGSFLQPDGAADGVDAVVRRVRQLVARGVDVIKIVSADGPETLGEWWTVQTTAEEAKACFAEARRLGRQTAAHAVGAQAIKNVVAAGVGTVEHGWYLDEEACRMMVEAGTHLVPTLGNAIAIRENGPALHMPWVEMFAGEEAGVFERIGMAVEMGVKIAMGSDVGGNEAHQHGNNALELECYVRCGMTPMQSIEAATKTAAGIMRMQEEIGTIEVGKLADLVLIEGDPLADVSLVRTGVVGVVQGGSVIRDDLGLLDELRRDASGRRRERALA